MRQENPSSSFLGSRGFLEPELLDTDGPTTRGWVSEWTRSDPDEMPTELVDAATMAALLSDIEVLHEATVEPSIEEEVDDPSSIEMLRALRAPIREARRVNGRALVSVPTTNRRRLSVLEVTLVAVSIVAVALLVVRVLQ